MKRGNFLSLFVSLSLVLSSISIATPTKAYAANQAGPIVVRAVLYSLDTGDRVELPIKVQDIQLELSAAADSQNVEGYVVELPRNLLQNMDQRQRWDQTYSVRVTFQMYYSERYVSDGREVALDYYMSKWEKFDYSVSWRDAHIYMGCFDGRNNQICPGSPQTAWINPVVSGYWYPATTTWQGVYVLMNDFGSQAGWSRITLSRGSSTWQLELCISQGGGAFCY